MTGPSRAPDRITFFGFGFAVATALDLIARAVR